MALTKELALEELELVAGGRKMNADDMAEMDEISWKYNALHDYLYATGQEDRWPALKEEIRKACSKWQKKIYEESSEVYRIYFSWYFDFDKYLPADWEDYV